MNSWAFLNASQWFVAGENIVDNHAYWRFYLWPVALAATRYHDQFSLENPSKVYTSILINIHQKTIGRSNELIITQAIIF